MNEEETAAAWSDVCGPSAEVKLLPSASCYPFPSSGSLVARRGITEPPPNLCQVQTKAHLAIQKMGNVWVLSESSL